MPSVIVLKILGVITTLVYIAGAVSALHAALYSRTSQGAIAWAVSLVTFPYITLPLYWTFGRNKFIGYVDARRRGNLEINYIAQDMERHFQTCRAELPAHRAEYSVLERLVKTPFVNGNTCELLINGDATFEAIQKGIEAAKDYILVQFFIVRDDKIGREIQQRLIDKARSGVAVYFLFDSVGSIHLSESYITSLRLAGVQVHGFRTAKNLILNRYQLNFRNHRKIVVIDGKTAFVGGLNLGDEYLSRDPKMSPWRDTHMTVQGPAVQSVQLVFLEDWYWATSEVPPLCWVPEKSERGNQSVLALPSGPADELETCSLFFVQAIQSAQQRVWIASPYFVPDVQVVAALQLAALRGVDVRILLPQQPDHYIVYLAAFAYLRETETAGVKLYRYQPGFLHSKVILVDDDVAAVGTANLDNRSFRLNFEITMVVQDQQFASQVAGMLQQDFQRSKLIPAGDFARRPLWFRAAAHVSRLLSPIL